MTPPKLNRFLPVICSPFVAYAGWIAASEPMIWAMPQAARAVALRVEPVPVSPASPLPSLSQGETL